MNGFHIKMTWYKEGGWEGIAWNQPCILAYCGGWHEVK